MYIFAFECFEDEDIIFWIEGYFQVPVFYNGFQYRVKKDFGLKKMILSAATYTSRQAN